MFTLHSIISEGGASSVRKSSGHPPPALGCRCPETPSPPPGTKNVFFHQITGACGNVPGPKTRFFSKKRRLRQRSNTKNLFFQKKRRLRQRTRTKNLFFSEKKAPAATYQDQKRFFHRNLQPPPAPLQKSRAHPPPALRGGGAYYGMQSIIARY